MEEFWVTPARQFGLGVTAEHDVLTIWTAAAECLADNSHLNAQACFNTGVMRYSRLMWGTNDSVSRAERVAIAAVAGRGGFTPTLSATVR